MQCKGSRQTDMATLFLGSQVRTTRGENWKKLAGKCFFVDALAMHGRSQWE